MLGGGSGSYRDWSVEPTSGSGFVEIGRALQEHSPDDDVSGMSVDMERDLSGTGLDGRLTFEEDSDLRRLNYLADKGQLSERSWERFVWLRLRDRRQQIRAPREFGANERQGDDQAENQVGRPAEQPGRVRKLFHIGR